MTKITMTLIVAASVFCSVPVSAAPPVNMTGTWEYQNQGYYFKLRQSGDIVTGKSYKGSLVLVRGGWTLGYLVLVINNKPEDANRCDRTVFVAASKGTVKNVDGRWVGGGYDKLSRTSADGGETVAYPYEKELKTCGDLATYEVAFDVNSDVLKGNDWPILAAVAGLLKQDPNLKIRVVGHTDSTGNAEHNRKLSVKRAEAVKKKLVERYGADEKRIQAEGMGADQPIEDNKTDLGRAVNRRVEIAIAQ